MTARTFVKIPIAQRLKEGGTDAGQGIRVLYYGAYGNSNITAAAVEGWHETGYLEEWNGDAVAEDYVAMGGIPEVEVAARKQKITKEISFTLSYPEEKFIAIAEGLGAPTVNYPGVANNTTIDTGVGAPTATTISVTAASGANYAAGDLIEIVVGDSTNGTASVFRRIKSISTDTFTLYKALGELPENGAAVKEVASLDYKVTTDDYGSQIQLLKVDNHNFHSNLTVEHIPNFQPVQGTVVSGNGKDEYKVTIKGRALGDYDSSNDRYVLSTRTTYAYNP